MRPIWAVTAASLTLPMLALAQSAAPPDTQPAAPAQATPVQPPAAAPAQAAPPVVRLPQVDVIGASPLLGSGVDRNTVPAATGVLTSDDLTRGGTATASTLRTLNEDVGGVNLDSAAGNPYQPNLFFHGFEASPLQGTPEGLAVYVNGVRFNQAFGDTVNFDLLPDLAIDKMNLVGSNPVFGLNALGGALSVQLKNGFTYHGTEMDLSGGSFDTIKAEMQFGQQVGNTAAYIAVSEQHQGGWRDAQSSDLQNLYGDVGWRGNAGEMHVNVLLAQSKLNGPGTSPVELLAADPKTQFTAPNQIDNKFVQISANANFDVGDNDSVQAVAYYNNFRQEVTNGNAANDVPCGRGENEGFLCSSPATPAISGMPTTPGVLSTTLGGAFIPAFLGDNGAYSELDNQTTNTNGYGASVQATDERDVFGRNNHLVVGLSFDGAQTEFGGLSYIGGITDVSRFFIGPGVIIDEPGQNQPVQVAISDAYYGAFFADTYNLTDRLALTASGRFNAAQIDLTDQNGGDLTGNHSYDRFNPAAGVTYKATPWLTAYAGYAEANRAPTPAELSCASPLDSCSLANFFVGDPNLKQVVAHTVEAGVRGSFDAGGDAKVSYSFGVYHTDLDNDIEFVNAETSGRAFFENVGPTRRQGIDAGVRYKAPRWSAFLDYSYTDATFQSGFTEDPGSNPTTVLDANGSMVIKKGDRLPGIPAHQVKFGLAWRVTDKWTVAANAVAQTGSFLFGDEANLTPQLPGYFTLNLSSSYQLTRNLQLFGSIENVTDARYYTFGTFAPTTSVSQAPGATNPRAYSPAAPVGAFGGVRATF